MSGAIGRWTAWKAWDWIDQTFLQVKDSTWLPQWSFDFWIIPYVLGKGVKEEQFKSYMQDAQQMLAMEIAFVPEAEKAVKQKELLAGMVKTAETWKDLV